MTEKDPQLLRAKEAFSWRKRKLSFRFAYRGLVYVFRTQHNMWLHALAAAIVVLLGFLFDITSVQWLIVLLCIALVFSLEIINTAIEVLVDHLHPDQHPKIGLVKDLAAGAVLAAACVTFIIGCCIFGPHLLAVLHTLL